MDKNFLNKNIIITGCLGELGRGISEDFLSMGAVVFGIDTEEAVKDKKEFIKEMNLKYNDKYHVSVCDITEVEAIREYCRELSENKIDIDVLVNNAGINMMANAVDVTEENWNDILDVNLKGTFFMSKEVVQLMNKDSGGSIINISSQHGVVGNYKRAPYCASKGGIVNLTKALCLEWAEYNIRVNSILPTFILTSKSEQWLMKPGIYRKYIQDIPMKRYCLVDDIVNAVRFFAGNGSSMITGQALAVDGGYLAK
ncbi:MAG: SDR family oxidoreductase [Ruminococcus sp.]|nr:SDR family oxidoreductase [Ruminococcus sp.]